MTKLPVFNNSHREYLLIGILVGIVLSLAAYGIGLALGA